jgi:hypothetical protein
MNLTKHYITVYDSWQKNLQRHAAASDWTKSGYFEIVDVRPYCNSHLVTWWKQ